MLTVVDDLEKEIGQRASVFAVHGTLTDHRLHEALHKRREGKHVGVPVGLERHFMFNLTFGTLFLECVKRALIYQLLTGEEKDG